MAENTEETQAQEAKQDKAAKVTPRLKEYYFSTVRDELTKKFDYKNPHQVPRFEKIVVNMGVGEAATDAKAIEGAVADLTTITGQKPLVTHARKSIATFKLRQGMAIGAKVTLRGDRMWEFLDRLIAVAIPRIRDFRGISPTSFDGRGNFSMGVTEQLIFPEIDYDKIDRTRGMDITIVTSAPTDEEGRALLEAFHFPFKRD
ncbi:MAG: 50S ribosomal protein L5 [Atopobiaceae bacterium]|nr:50S ribosomal protein L5 [Atopobiaceae bacterium]